MSELRAPTPISRIKPTHRGFAPRAGSEHRGVVLTPTLDDDLPWGQPIDDPPPIIEGFLDDEPPIEAAPEPAPPPELPPAPEPAPPLEPPPATPGRPARRAFLAPTAPPFPRRELPRAPPPDRKSTRLNSSHDQISYAVFCLKKK